MKSVMVVIPATTDVMVVCHATVIVMAVVIQNRVVVQIVRAVVLPVTPAIPRRVIPVILPVRQITVVVLVIQLVIYAKQTRIVQDTVTLIVNIVITDIHVQTALVRQVHTVQVGRGLVLHVTLLIHAPTPVQVVGLIRVLVMTALFPVVKVVVTLVFQDRVVVVDNSIVTQNTVQVVKVLVQALVMVLILHVLPVFLLLIPVRTVIQLVMVVMLVLVATTLRFVLAIVT